MSPEFNLIAQYFTRPSQQADLGVGDDAALISISSGMQLAISADMLVAGTHFFADCDPYQLGWKSLAVNISDMAAMGAQPKWATLAIALPSIDDNWLKPFSQGFFACAEQFGADLIGGDTTRGPLNISVQIMGEVPLGKALKRSGAKMDEDIWVSGSLGSAALGLAHLQNKVYVLGNALPVCLNALHIPTPRLALGLALHDIASSCIDISDGLLADLGHILHASIPPDSTLGAKIYLEQIPCIDYLKQDLQNPQIQQAILAGGDDYELCFTAPKSKRAAIHMLSNQLGLALTLIGETHASTGIQVMHNNQKLTISSKGFDHFG
ncbi:MAG: thiamine-phosphate kinase [Pseudomonadota bacterium]